MVNSSAGFWYPFHWDAIANEVRVAGQTNDLGEFDASVFSGHAVSMLKTNQQYLEDFLNHLGGGLRFATKVVAASDSLDIVKAHSDYVCTGVNDDVTIQTAINALPSFGGKVLLMEGHFFPGRSLGVAGAEISLRNGVTLEGMGAGTFIEFPNGFSSASAAWLIGGSDLANPVVRNMVLDVNSSNNVGANLGAWFFSGCSGARIVDVWVLDGNTTVAGCNLQLDGVGGTASTFSAVLGCHIVGTTLNVTGDADQLFKTVIANNTVKNGGITINNAGYIDVFGNVVADYSGGTAYGVYVFAAAWVNVSNNHISACQVGVFVDGAPTRIAVKDNYIAKCQHEAIDINQGADCAVQDNFVSDCSQASAGTYNAINVGVSTCTNTNVQGNTIRGTAHAHGVSVGGSSTAALVVNNDMKNGYTTSATSDAGVGTLFNLDGSANNWNRP